jgi:Spy/CpxP family protein refolding chaperone
MKSKTTASLLLILTFLMGSASGAITAYFYMNQTSAAGTTRINRSRSWDSAEELAKALQLDGEQQEQLQAILKHSRNRYRTLSRQFRPQNDAIRKEMNDSIRRILTPDQQVRFDEIMQEIRSRRKSRHK